MLWYMIVRVYDIPKAREFRDERLYYKYCLPFSLFSRAYI
jgi:hypothetical protein